jgi:transcriptional regulator with XRE-family HTH domain
MNRKAFGERVKALRQQKGWSQDELARRVRVERNSVNRWEMGERAPALAMIERIAAALGVSIDAVLPDLAADQGRGALAVPARIIAFDPRAIARHPAAGSLLGLMTITNEIRTFRRLLIISQEQLHAGPTLAERAVYVGESGSFFRLLCALLHEASGAIDQVERKAPGLLAKVAREHAAAASALTVIRAAYAASNKEFLREVRNWVVRHYDDRQLERQLAKGVNAERVPGELIQTPHGGLGRYTITDEIATHVVRTALGVDERHFQTRFYEKLGELIQVSEALAVLVDHAIEHLVKNHITSIEDSALRVDPLIARARRAVMAERKKAEGAMGRRAHGRAERA